MVGAVTLMHAGLRSSGAIDWLVMWAVGFIAIVALARVTTVFAGRLLVGWEWWRRYLALAREDKEIAAATRVDPRMRQELQILHDLAEWNTPSERAARSMTRKETPMDRIRPRMFSHVVYRTRRFDQMLAWYLQVFGARVRHQNPALAFLTYDDEHHRIALADLDVLQPGDTPGEAPKDKQGLVGVDHVAYTIASLEQLVDHYEQLRQLGIKPYWCVHHGVTISMYYADPDGNQSEFQVDCFDSSEHANAFMSGPEFEQNPIGVEFDPDQLLRRRKVGRIDDFLRRTVHQPVSPIRGPLSQPTR